MNENMIFSCPHCQHRYTDELELLDTDKLHVFKCESCSEAFTMLLMECLSCTKETVFVWTEPPPPIIVTTLCCGSCGTVAQSGEELEQDN